MEGYEGVDALIRGGTPLRPPEAGGVWWVGWGGVGWGGVGCGGGSAPLRRIGCGGGGVEWGCPPTTDWLCGGGVEWGCPPTTDWLCGGVVVGVVGWGEIFFRIFVYHSAPLARFFDFGFEIDVKYCMHPTPRRRLGEWQEITGELNMNSTGKIVQLVNPTANQDAATKFYVDTKTTDMATSSTVSTAITNALGSSGTQENRPTIQRDDDPSSSNNYLTYIRSDELPGNSLSRRALMRCENSLSYNPSTNTLTAGIFSGSLSGNASTAGTAGSATSATTAGSAGDISKASDSTFTVNGSERMRITSAGRVGIGTTSPETSLHVNTGGSAAQEFQTYGGFIGGEQSATGLPAYGFAPQTGRNVVALFSGGWVAADNTAGFIIKSDQRIKSDIVTLDTNIGLELYRKLRVVKHSYIDKKNFGNITKYGFIAQEVQQLLPDAVIPKTDIIPSIYKTATIVNHQTLHFDNPLKDIQQFNIGTKLKCYDVKNEIVWATIKCVIDTQNIEIEEEITSDKLFVYGHSVDDFLQIDYDPIRNLTTAVLQEVDRQQQADKVRIAELEAKVSEQQSLINDIHERLNNAKI